MHKFKVTLNDGDGTSYTHNVVGMEHGNAAHVAIDKARTRFPKKEFTVQSVEHCGRLEKQDFERMEAHRAKR